MYKEIDQETLKAIVAEHEDILTPLVEADRAIYNDASCLRCGGKTFPENDLRHLKVSEDGSEVYVANSRPIPRKLCRCTDCGSLMDPFSGLLVEMGNLGKVEPRIPIIYPK